MLKNAEKVKLMVKCGVKMCLRPPPEVFSFKCVHFCVSWPCSLQNADSQDNQKHVNAAEIPETIE